MWSTSGRLVEKGHWTARMSSAGLLLILGLLLRHTEAESTVSTDFPYRWKEPTGKTFECLPGWKGRGNKCYRVFTFSSTWDDAQNTCASMGSTLVKIEDVIENIYVGGEVKSANALIDSWWVGFKTQGLGPEATWSDGKSTSVNVVTWDVHQPQREDSSMCAHASKKDTFPWSLTRCYERKPFVCERAKCLTGNAACRNGRCVPTSALCDGQNDCGDASDESNCASKNYCTKVSQTSTGGVTFPESSDKKENDEYYCTLYLEGTPGKKIIAEFSSLTNNLNHMIIYCGGSTLVSALLVDLVYGNNLAAARKPAKYLCPDNLMIIQVAGNSPSDRDLVKIDWMMAAPDQADGMKEERPNTDLVDIRSPFYNTASDYGNLNARFWLLTDPYNIMTLNIEWSELNLSPGQKLRLYDGQSAKGYLLADLSSRSQYGKGDTPSSLMTTGNKAYLELTSDMFARGGTYKISYRSGCRMETMEDEGVIMSPGYSQAPYPPAITCTWEISSNMSNQLFTFQLDPNFEIDSSDTLKIGQDVVTNATNTSVPITKPGPVTVSFRVTPREDNKNIGFKAKYSIGCRTFSPAASVAGKQPAAWGDQLNISCDENSYFSSARYANNTEVTLTCMKGGMWDEEETSLLNCETRVCGEPTPIENGYAVNMNASTVGGLAFYECFPGFTISSAQPALCTKDGWDNLPDCGELVCPPLNGPADGNVTYTNGNGTTTGTIASFSCDPGYDLLGDGIINCMISGQWSGIVKPTCQPLTCLVPNLAYAKMINTMNSAIVQDVTVPLDTNLTIQCDPGYKLNISDPTVTCQPDRTFGKIGLCYNIDECETNNGDCDQGCKDTVGNYTCFCNDGFRLESDGHTCTGLDLCTLRRPCEGSCENGNGTYTCSCPAPGKELYRDPGFNGIQPARTESSLLPWHMPAVNHSCVNKQCPSLNLTIPNGELVNLYKDYYYYGDVAIYRCDLGYVISQEPSVVNQVNLTCTQSGTWDEQPPVCVEARCETFTTSSNPFLTSSAPGNVTYETSVNYTCTVPGRSIAIFTAMCRYSFDDNTYIMMGEPPVCEQIDCGVPQIADDKLIGINSSSLPLAGSTFYGSYFEFVCDTNSTLSGNSTLGNLTVPCEDNGRWGLGDLRCLARSCTDPGYPVGGTQADVVSYEANQIVTFSCDQNGYFPDPPLTQCIFMNDGNVNWNDTRTPVCKDGEAPVFACASNGSTSFNIDRGVAPINVVNLPTATDNTGIASTTADFNVNAALFSNKIIVWTALDFEGNSATCAFDFIIKDPSSLILECPSYVNYTMMNYMDTSLVNVAEQFNVTGSQSLINVRFNPPSIVLSESLANSAVVVEIEATDTSFQTAQCRTTINVQVQTCGPWALIGPKNGFSNCTYVANVQMSGQPGYECRPACNPGYVFYTSLEPGLYTCQEGGTFSPSPSVPSCVESQTALYTRTMSLTYSHNLVSGCLETIRAQLATRLNDNLINGADGFDSTCKKLFPTLNINITGDVEVNVLSASTFTALFKISLAGPTSGLTYCGNKVTEDFQLLNVPPATSLSKKFLTTIDTESIFTPCGGCIGESCKSVVYYNSDSFVDQTANLPFGSAMYGYLCPTSTIMQLNAEGSYDCASCPPGYKTINATCVECPAGMYQNQSAQELCIPCPEGTNSPFTANPYAERCFRMCPAGFRSLSSDGLAPCEPCGENEFGHNSTACSSCPIGQVTLDPVLGSPAASSCKSACPDGTFTGTGYQPDCKPCPIGFYGNDNHTTCEACPAGNTTLTEGATNITLCTDSCTLGCSNGGVCVINNTAPRCECPAGYTGPLCATQLDPCRSNPCYNNGNCTALSGVDFQCSCASSSSEVMKLVAFNADYIQSWINYLNVSVVKECQDYCLKEPVCQAISFNPNPPAGFPVKQPCLIFSSSTGQTGVQQGYTLYKKASAVSQYFNGSRCEEDPINECEQINCQNGGQCRDMPGYAECLCSTVDVFSGDFCEEAQEICQKDPCQNGATCQSVGSIRRVCICANGYTGRNCETQIDMCRPNPCYYGAACTPGIGSYTCACPDGFSGLTCDQRPANPCTSLSCDDGRCVDDYRDNTVMCVCNDGFFNNNNNNNNNNNTNRQCERVDPCSRITCQNGNCSVNNVTMQATCDCDEGYQGAFCQHDINECASKPCRNGGMCEQGVPGTFNCSCTSRYQGLQCEDLILLCENKPCAANGTVNKGCADTPAGYQCTCLPGFTGKRCEMEINECDSQPCLHGGNCTDLDNDFQCACPPGWTGKTCGDVEGECTPSTCANGATCFNVSRNTYCHCPLGSFGDRCENSPSKCENANPCMYDSTCSEVNGRRVCNCTYGYEGEWCEQKTDFCGISSRCENGATCVLQGRNYACTCPPGFTGRHCETNANDCASVTCQNNGEVKDGVDLCTCKCKPGFSGPRCATVFNNTYLLDFTGPSQGVYPVFSKSDAFTFTAFVRYAKAGDPGTFVCLYGLNKKDDPLAKAVEITCLKDGLGNNDGQEHFVAISSPSPTTADFTLDSTVSTKPITDIRQFEYIALVVGREYNKVQTQFTGSLRSIRFWGTSSQNLVRKARDEDSTSLFDSFLKLGDEPPFMSGSVRPLFGSRPSPSTKIFPTLLPGGCPDDLGVTAGSQLSVVATIPDPKFNPATFSETTNNYASGLPRQTGIYDVQTVAEKGEAYGTCAFNLYIRYGTCETPKAPIGGDSPTCRGDGLHRGCNATCPDGRAFLRLAPQIYTCGALGVFSRDQPRQPFSFPPCGEKLESMAVDVTITAQYNILGEKEGATSNPSLFTLRLIIKKAINNANNLTSLNGGTPMCDGTCDVTVMAVNSKKELTTVTVKLTNVSMTVGPGAQWSLSNFLKQQVLQDMILDASPKAGLSGLTVPYTGARDISGTLGFSLTFRPNCPRLYQAVGSECVKCTPGTYFNATSAICIPCPVGEYNALDGQETCTPCGSQKTTLSEGAANNTDCVDICQPGTRFNRTDMTCVDCGRGFYQPESGQSLCLSCDVGQTTTIYNATAKSDCIAQCVAGQYLTLANTCELCRVGLYRRLEDNTCQQCPGSTTTPDKGAESPSNCTIRLCVPGQKNVNNTCVPCEIGTYSTSNNDVECTPCRPGNSTRAPGASSPNICETFCGNGTFLNVNTSQCESCPPDTYKGGSHSNGFAQACVGCPSGLRTDGDGKTSIADCKFPVCKRGEYVNPLFVANPQAIGVDRCLKCAKDSYQPLEDPRNATCIPCPDLTVTAMKGSTSNESCTAMNITTLAAVFKIQAECSTASLTPSGTLVKQLTTSLTDPNNPESIGNKLKGSLGNKADNVKGIVINGFKYLPDRWIYIDPICGSIQVNFDILFLPVSDAGNALSTKEISQALNTIVNSGGTIGSLPTVSNSGQVALRTVGCVAGQGVNLTTGEVVCEDCPVGTYQKVGFKDTCEKCPNDLSTSGPGQVWDAANQPTQNPCRKSCPAGKEPDVNNACKPCPEGTYKTAEGVGNCTACGPNTITLQPGATTLDLCIASCDPGFYSTINVTTGNKECAICAKGSYSTIKNSIKCTSCTPMYTTKGEGMTKPADCINLCEAGGYCLNGATCRFDQKEQKPYCDCRIPYQGDKCQTRGEPPLLSQTTIIVLAVIGGVAGIFLIAMVIFVSIVLTRRRQQKVTKSQKGMKYPLINQPIYSGEGPVYATSIAPGHYYYPMGVSGRRYPLVPEVTSRSVASMAAPQHHVPAIQHPAQPRYMFYEDRDEDQYGTVDPYYTRGVYQYGPAVMGRPRVSQTKTAYFS